MKKLFFTIYQFLYENKKELHEVKEELHEVKELKKENTSVSNAADKKLDFTEFILDRLA